MIFKWLSSIKAPRIGSIFDRFVPSSMTCPAHGVYTGGSKGCPSCDIEVEHFIKTGRWRRARPSR